MKGPEGETEIRDTLHDLNNVMARILTTAELIAAETGDEQTRDDAHSIRQAAVEGRDLIARICTWLRTLDRRTSDEERGQT